MKARNRFATNEMKAIVYRLAEENDEWDVDLIYERLSTQNIIDWLGYWKWKAAMLDQARQREEVRE